MDVDQVNQRISVLFQVLELLHGRSSAPTSRLLSVQLEPPGFVGQLPAIPATGMTKGTSVDLVTY
jgi:hypothetical protein